MLMVAENPDGTWTVLDPSLDGQTFGSKEEAEAIAAERCNQILREVGIDMDREVARQVENTPEPPALSPDERERELFEILDALG